MKAACDATKYSHPMMPQRDLSRRTNESHPVNSAAAAQSPEAEARVLWTT